MDICKGEDVVDPLEEVSLAFFNASLYKDAQVFILSSCIINGADSASEPYKYNSG